MSTVITQRGKKLAVCLRPTSDESVLFCNPGGRLLWPSVVNLPCAAWSGGGYVGRCLEEEAAAEPAFLCLVLQGPTTPRAIWIMLILLFLVCQKGSFPSKSIYEDPDETLHFFNVLEEFSSDLFLDTPPGCWLHGSIYHEPGPLRSFPKAHTPWALG